MYNKHGIQSTDSWSCIATVIVVALSVASQLPAKSAEQRGRVESSGSVRRIARPQEGRTAEVRTNASNAAQAGPLSGSVDKFTLPGSADQSTMVPEVEVGTWQPLSTQIEGTPWPASPPSEGPVRRAMGLPAAASNAPVRTAIDYNAIEKAYSDLIRPALATVSQRRPGGSSGQDYCPFGPLVPTAHGPAPAGGLPAFSGARPVVAVDNCVCGTPIPSAACSMGNMVGTYSPQVGGQTQSGLTQPGIGNVLNGTAVPGGNAMVGRGFGPPIGRAIGTGTGR